MVLRLQHVLATKQEPSECTLLPEPAARHSGSTRVGEGTGIS